LPADSEAASEPPCPEDYIAQKMKIAPAFEMSGRVSIYAAPR
jgi:hypothetical protein